MRTRFATYALAVVLVLYYVGLLMAAERGNDDARRHETLLNLASFTSARSANVTDDGTSVTLAADQGVATASWETFSYQVANLIERSRSCSLSATFLGLNATSPDRRGSAEILVNGDVLKTIHFGSSRRGLFPVAKSRFVPANVIPQVVELVPLDSRFAIVAPIPERYCSASSLTIGVRVRGATWTIDQEGFSLTYSPTPFSPRRGLSMIVAAAIVLGVAIATLCLVLHRMACLSLGALAATAVVLALAPLGYDQWDFRLWVGFGEFAVFGASDPAYLWFGSPLWTFVPAIFASVTGAEFFISGHGSDASTALFLKIGMSLAYCFTASEIAARAPVKLRRYFALTALLVPVSLYELTGGYREIFASALAIGCLASALKGRVLIATILAATAASISEEFLPFIAFPAAIAMIGRYPWRVALGKMGVLFAIGFGLFLAEWRFLIPPDFATAALRYRFGAAPLGDASWAGALQGLGLLPVWLPVQSVAFNVTLFGCLAALPAIRLANLVRKSRVSAFDGNFDSVVGIFIAFVGAFLLAFRGTDPNLWYPFIVLSLWYVASADPLNAFPLLVGSIEGLTYYVTVGLRDFVNHSFFWPVDVGLLGTLGSTRFILDLTICALILAWIVTLSVSNRVRLVSANTPFVWVIFITAVLIAATGTYVLDVLVVLPAAFLIGRLLWQLCRARKPRVSYTLDIPRGVGVLILAAGGAICGTRSGLAGLCGTAACVFAIRRRIAVCDIVLLGSASGIIAVQPGDGLISEIASIAFVLLTLLALLGLDERLLRRVRSTGNLGLTVRGQDPLAAHDVV